MLYFQFFDEKALVMELFPSHNLPGIIFKSHMHYVKCLLISSALFSMMKIMSKRKKYCIYHFCNNFTKLNDKSTPRLICLWNVLLGEANHLLDSGDR